MRDNPNYEKNQNKEKSNNSTNFKNEGNSKNNESLRKGFFKKAKISVFNVEKYPELATEGIARAIGYLVKLIAILAVIICVGLLYKTNKVVNQGVDYLENDFPDFAYQDGILDVKTEDVFRVENEFVGKIIVDTKEDLEEMQTTNSYINEITETGNGIIVLKDKIIIKNELVMGTATYKYSELLEQMGFTKFDKQEVIQYLRGTQIISLYLSVFVTMFIYSFIMYFINTIIYVLMCSVFGYLATLFAKIKMRYAAIFNMSVYAITLSTILNMIYMVINMFTDFTIQYFEVMYVSVAAIYLFAAIFIIKDDFNKKQTEIMKIVEVQKEIRKQMDKQKEEEKEEKNKNKNQKPNENDGIEENKRNEEHEKKESDKEKERNEGNDEPTPEGTNAWKEL